MPDNGLGELERLSGSETLLIKRRRLGEDQHSAAKRHGVSQSMYGKWERDEVDGPEVNILPLRAHERCLLYRRRSGDTQEDVAAQMGCCRYWLNLLEKGDVPCDKLLWFWEQ